MKMKSLMKTMACALSFVLALSAVPAETVKAEESATFDAVYADEKMTAMDVSGFSDEELAAFDEEREEYSVSFEKGASVRRIWKAINRYEYDENNQVESHTDYAYDANGNQIGYVQYNGAGTSEADIDYVSSTTYDASGNRTKSESVYYDEGKISSYYIYTYNADGNRIKYENYDYDDDGSVNYSYIREYTYYPNGECETEKYYYNGELRSTSYYEYGGDGTQLLKVKEYSAKTNKLTSVEEYIYDGDNCIRENYYNVQDGKEKLSYYYKYTYDANGNEILSERYSIDSNGNEKLSSKTAYEYTLIRDYYYTTAYIYYSADGTISSGWRNIYDERGSYTGCINYGKGGEIESYEYSGSLITPDNPVVGDLATSETTTYDATNTKIIARSVTTYQLFVIESDGSAETPVLNGLKAASDGNWYKYVNGNIDRDYTGLYCDPVVGWWLVIDGRVAFDYSGLWGDPNLGWWLVNGGAVNFDYTGLYCDANVGWWLVGGGAVCFDYNGLWGDPVYGWWLVEGGTVNFGYTGLYCDANVGWWLVGGGAVCFDYNDLWCDPVVGWWLVEGGAPSFGFTGLVQYNGSWWYVENGALNFGFTGQVTANDGTYNVVNGCVVF